MTVALRPSSNRTGGFPASGSPRAIPRIASTFRCPDSKTPTLGDRLDCPKELRCFTARSGLALFRKPVRLSKIKGLWSVENSGGNGKNCLCELRNRCSTTELHWPKSGMCHREITMFYLRREASSFVADWGPRFDSCQPQPLPVGTQSTYVFSGARPSGRFTVQIVPNPFGRGSRQS